MSLNPGETLNRRAATAVVLISLLLLSPGCEGNAPTANSTLAPNEPLRTSLETAALTAFYNATNGPGWTDNTAWLSDAPVGEWHGVAVNDDGGVIGLALGRNGLSGEIPPDLADLSNLESLVLNRNQLSGEIPPELGNLANLADLRLNANQLSGPIPPELANLASLTSLRLTGNQLSGEIPPELADLANLTDLRLHGNQLSGQIPPELGDLANLTNLFLGTNQLSGPIPPELDNLTNLTTLFLGGNQLSGEIPPELGNLSELTNLQLGRSRLSGQIPPELGNLTNLTHLSLDINQLNGQIPPELGNLTNLVYLGLERNRLSGTLPAELGNLSKLEDLRLAWNQLNGQIPPELGDLANLTTLEIHANRLSGEIPATLGNLGNLTELSLGHNQLSGKIPAELGKLVQLAVLALSWNQLSGEIPPGLAGLANLTDLRLEGNGLSGEIPPGLSRPAPVRVAPGIAETPASERLPAIYLEAVFGGRRFERPTEVGAYPVGPAAAESGLFVAEQEGRVLLLRPDASEVEELLDINDRVSRVGSDEGLLSVALGPRFEETGHIWLYYTAAGVPRTTRLSRFAADPSNLRLVDPGSELIVLEIDQPDEIHHGGAIRFGPDGMLYLGLGDSSARDEPQRLETLLGSIVRIDVSAASEASPYAVPRDNPFIDLPIAQSEIWAYGFRNPWRMAFDPATGVLWAGDVGNANVEEIDHVEAGGNFGWNRFEGTRCVSPSAGCDPYGFVAPVVEYSHKLGCAVVGGVVYRGEAIPALAGHYLFTDFCGGQLWAVPPDGGDVVELAVIPPPVSSFGTDSNGEVYILTFGGPVLRIASL